MGINIPNGNQKQFFGQKVSKEGKNVYNASDADLIYKNDYSTTTYYDTTNSRVALGLLPDGTYGLQVSKPGYNVTDNNDSNLIFNSAQDIFKIIKSGTVSVTLSSSSYIYTLLTQTITINHGLGYIPANIAYVSVDNDFSLFGSLIQPYTPGQYLALPASVYYLQTINTSPIAKISQPMFNVWTQMDDNNLYIIFNQYAYNPGVNYTYNCKYYLLQETAN